MASKRRYTYVGNGTFKVFTSIKKMKIFAQEKENNGKYYISCHDITFTYSRDEILSIS